MARTRPASFSAVPPLRAWLALALVAGVAAWPASLAAHGGLHDRIAELSAALAQQPDDPAPRFALAVLLCGHDEWSRGLDELARVDAVAPDRFPTARLRGQALLGLGRTAEALTELHRALEREPGELRARRDRARAFAQLGRTAESLADYRAVWTSTAAPEVDFAVETAAAFRDAGETAEACAVLDRALAQLGAEPVLLKQALAFDLAARRFDAALLRVDALRSRDPRPEPWMARRAEIYAAAGRTAEARAAWQTLADHLAALPNLQRGVPALQRLAAQARAALANFSVHSVDPDAPPRS